MLKVQKNCIYKKYEVEKNNNYKNFYNQIIYGIKKLYKQMLIDNHLKKNKNNVMIIISYNIILK